MAGGPRGRKFSGVKIQISNIEQIHEFRRLNINSWRCYYLILRQKFIFSLVSNHSIGPGRPDAWERSLGSRAGPDGLGQVLVAWARSWWPGPGHGGLVRVLHREEVGWRVRLLFGLGGPGVGGPW